MDGGSKIGSTISFYNVRTKKKTKSKIKKFVNKRTKNGRVIKFAVGRDKASGAELWKIISNTSSKHHSHHSSKRHSKKHSSHKKRHH